MSRTQALPALHGATLAGIGQRLQQVQHEMGAKLPTRLLPPHIAILDGAWAVNACRPLRVDPRWLLLGIKSQAAESAIRHVTDNCRSNGLGHDDELIPLLAMLPESFVFRGVCRYCLCTDEAACPGGCCWLDDDHSICSACLDPDSSARLRRGAPR